MPLFLGLLAVVAVAFFASRGKEGFGPMGPRTIIEMGPDAARYSTSFRQIYELSRQGREGTDGAWIGIGPINAKGQAISPGGWAYAPTYGSSKSDLIAKIEAHGFLTEG